MIDTQDNKNVEKQETSLPQKDQEKMDDAVKNASDTTKPKDAAK